MTVLGSLARRETRAVQATTWGEWPGDSAVAWSGVNVDSRNALQLLTVYGCVRLISDSISTLPLDVFREAADGTREQIDTPLWLETPVIGLDRVAWLTQILSSLLLDGNAWLMVTRDSAGRILELIPLNASVVAVRREQGKRVVYVNGQPAKGEVLHIPGLMLAGAEVGYSPIEAARQSIGLGMAAQESGARLFGQGMTTAGVVEVPGEMPPDKAKDLAATLARRHSGKSKAHLPAVLTAGATWKQTSLTNEQAQWLETRGFTAAEIAGQMFLVDPSDLGIPVNGTSLTYANLTDRNTRRVQITLLPWIVRLERAFSKLLAQSASVKLNVNGLLRGDTKSRFETYKIGIDSGIYTAAEPRELEDLPPLDGAKPPSFKEQIDALGQLIRAGFEPDSALTAVGLDPIKHTGLVPVTVTEESTSTFGVPNA